MYALIDCNNFFVSCERVMNPKLRDKPVAILSNNDGCIVARSNEVKAAGIPMGAPYFKWKERLEELNVRVYSSNYSLYGELSHRVHETLHMLLPGVSIYSIDEAFANVSGIAHLRQELEQVKQTVEQWTGVPVSIGAGPTKTIAKMANEIAKKHEQHAGVLIFDTVAASTEYHTTFPVGDLWGIGWNLGAKLSMHGVHTTADLLSKPKQWIKSELGRCGLNVLDELQGRNVTHLDNHPSLRKSVVCSRSFGAAVTSKGEIADALAYFADKAGKKLRDHGLATKMIRPFFTTSRFDEHRYYAATPIILDIATNDSRILARACREAVEGLYKAGYRYKKAGVICTDISDGKHVQTNLFVEESPRAKELMTAYDAIRKRFGEDTLHFGNVSATDSWRMRRERLSTPERRNIGTIPTVYCK